MKRQCDGCTKCCDGSLTGDAHGHSFYPGKPCFFLIINKGCTIYDDRPSPQCTEYECSWIQELEIPDWIKPNKTDTICSTVNFGGVSQLHVTKAGKLFKEEYLDWYKDYAKKTNRELSWYIDGVVGWQGSKELGIAVKTFFNI